MQVANIQKQWSAPPGWAKWEPTIARWLGPATANLLKTFDTSVGFEALTEMLVAAGTKSA